MSTKILKIFFFWIQGQKMNSLQIFSNLHFIYLREVPPYIFARYICRKRTLYLTISQLREKIKVFKPSTKVYLLQKSFKLFTGDRQADGRLCR